MSRNRSYSLENKIYPLSSLESEMERLFGNPVWYEEKIEQNAMKLPSSPFAGQYLAEEHTPHRYHTDDCGPPHSSLHLPPNNYYAGASNYMPLEDHTVEESTIATPTYSTLYTDRTAFPASFRKQRSKKPVCKFCLKNGEAEIIYENHVLRDEDGRIACPILRSHNCELCGATGDSAHTKKYCPLYEELGDNLFPGFRRLASGVTTTKLNHK